MAGERIELTVRLSRDGDTLRRAYSHPPYGQRPELDSSAPWESLGRQVEFQGRAGPEALEGLLDRGLETELEVHFTGARLAEVGHLLFALLFGKQEEWGPLLRGLFQEPDGPQPNPPRHPVRVRVLCDDPLLAGLPWRITAWQGKWLMDSGWTFEAVTGEQAERHVELRAPCKVLMIAPRCGQPLDTDDHYLDLKETLLRFSSHYEDENYLGRVETRWQLADALRGMRPQLLYYYGHGAVDGGQACLVLGEENAGPQLLTMNDLWRMLRETPPAAAYLNACMSGAAGWHSAGRQLIPEVACVVANRTTVWTGEAGETATGWLARLLGEGLDPVVALHRLPDEASTRGFEWAAAVAWTSFQSWQTHREIGPVPLHEPGLRLDRDIPRSVAHKHVTELIDSPARRVEAMLVYGTADSLVGRFSGQLRDYLERRRVCLAWLCQDVEPAAGVRFGEKDLEELLGLWLGRQRLEGLETLLRRRAPARGVSGSTPVLFLDWGVFRSADRPALKSAEIREWLLFCTDVLGRHCPPDIRVISYLAMEVAERNHRRLRKKMEHFRTEIRSQKFRCSHLPALGDVPFSELLDYLEEPANTRCPQTRAREAAKLIYGRTDGRYEETVELIRRGEQSWNRLLRELSTGGEPQTDEDDQPFD